MAPTDYLILSHWFIGIGIFLVYEKIRKKLPKIKETKLKTFLAFTKIGIFRYRKVHRTRKFPSKTQKLNTQIIFNHD